MAGEEAVDPLPYWSRLHAFGDVAILVKRPLSSSSEPAALAGDVDDLPAIPGSIRDGRRRAWHSERLLMPRVGFRDLCLTLSIFW